MEKLNKFTTFKTDNQLELHVCKNDKFKTNLIQFFIIEPLSKETVTLNALLPFVIYRGSTKYPSSRKFRIKLDELYGAELNVAVLKRGENQLINFSLEITNSNYLPMEEDLLEEGMKFIYEMLINPLFRAEDIEQEKVFLQKEIKSLINDKYSYSLERCYQEMCNSESFGIHKLGTIDGAEDVDKQALSINYNRIMKNSYLVMFVIGDLDEENVFNKVNQIFKFDHKQPSKINNTDVIKNVEKIKETRDYLNIQQGKLTMGFRTGITRENEDYYPLMFYNGILGGFPHSKLFQNVREKASLAYYATSKLESTKGLLMITSGIESDKYEGAREIILEQIENIKNGEISEQELEWTRKGLINSLKSHADIIKGLSGHYILGLINGKEDTIDQMIEKIATVKIEDIVKIAKNIKLDTIYFLDKRVDKE